MPTTLEIVAPVIAPATLPRATEVNTTDACTVDGSSDRYSSPVLSSGETTASGRSWTSRPSTGNAT